MTPPIEDAAHVFLHIDLCAAVVRAAESHPVPLRVKLFDRTGGTEYEKTVAITRADGTQAVVEFDVHHGVYLLHALAPQPSCAASDYLDFLPDLSRTVVETLAPGPLTAPAPTLLLDGTAPVSFLYVKPTFAFFNGPVACGAPVSTPSGVGSRVEYDQANYHVWLAEALPVREPVAPTVSVATSTVPTEPPVPPVTVALKLRTAGGLAHYVHMPITYPNPWHGWPAHVQFNVSEEMLASLATEKTGVLLCPKLWQTTVH